MGYLMVMENINILMEMFIKVNGKKEKRMEKEHTSGKMVKNMLDILRMMKSKMECA